MKSSAALLALIALLTAFVDDVAASCKQIQNEEMLEYFCEGGQPSDLTIVPETTEKLRIIKMPFSRITANTFSKFGGNLWVLSCSYCEITDIDEDAFHGLVNLQQLSLHNNYLTTVKASWFEGLDYLTYLDLNYNNIRDIENDVYRNLPNLVDFRISGNQLRCLNLNEMLHLKELKRIFLSENSDFACPNAVSKFFRNQGVIFEPDPEWRKLASDTINVSPSYTEGDRRTLQRPEQSKILSYTLPTRDRMFQPDHDTEHLRRPITTVQSTTSKQQNEIARFPPTKTAPLDSFSRQVMMPYPLSTPETLLAPPVVWNFSEEIKMIEPTNHGSLQTEHTSMYPQHIPQTYETMSKDPILERLRVSAEKSGFSTENDDRETKVESDSSSQAGTTLIYPLYVATFNDWEKTPHGSIQVTHNNDSDIVTVDSWSTDHSNKHPHWMHKHSSSSAESNDDRSPSTNTNSVPIAINPVNQANRSETTTTVSNDVHYVRPSISSPELMYSPSSNPGEFYSPYYETAVTVHPPLLDYRVTTTNDDLTTTDKSLPDCPERNSANSSSIRSYIVVLAMSIIAVFEHVIAKEF